MLTPMTSEELRRHRSMGLYKTQADMNKDKNQLKTGLNFAGSKHQAVGLSFGNKRTAAEEPVLDILPPAQYDIQGHDDI